VTPVQPPRTRAGLIKFRPLRPGGRIALVAPASSFARDAFDAGVAEITRLGFVPVFDESIFDRQMFTAGAPAARALALMRACDSMDADAVMAVRGGYGSVDLLPLLDADRMRRSRTAFIGYSDLTSLHSFLNGALHLASVHGPMIDGRLAKGPSAYDPASLLRCLSTEPLGELAPDGLEVIQPGEATGVLTGGTLTQLLASCETPYAFRPSSPHILFLDEVGERPYRLHRMLTQLRSSGRMDAAAGLVFGQLPRCDEPGGGPTARDVVRDAVSAFRGPVLFGFPSGHTTTPLVSLPFGVSATVIAANPPRLVIDEAAAAP
jgi:muramoyltetrapeptide carboxypeptidase